MQKGFQPERRPVKRQRRGFRFVVGPAEIALVITGRPSVGLSSMGRNLTINSERGPVRRPMDDSMKNKKNSLISKYLFVNLEDIFFISTTRACLRETLGGLETT